jgi:hypothetical protein
VCVKEIPPPGRAFDEAVKTLLKWFKGATNFDGSAVLEFPPVLSSEQRKLMHAIGRGINPKSETLNPKQRKLMHAIGRGINPKS